MSNQQLCVGLSLAVTWFSGNAWRRSDSHVEDILNPTYYINIAKLAENAHVDFLFRPDSLFVDPKALSHSVGFCALEPTLLMAAIAPHTSHIGLLTTASTTFNEPYIIARQLQSLHHISHGRAAWNIVTALDGHENFGLPHMPDVGIRYAKAKEFAIAVKKLWRSFPHEALTIDRNEGKFVTSELITTPDVKGNFFSVKGPMSLPMHDSGEVPLFQAGASEEGRDFAAQIADGIFAACPDIDSAKSYRDDVRARMQKYQRDANKVKVLPGLSLYLAASEEQAKALYLESQSSLDISRKNQFICDSLGIDITQLTEETKISASLIGPFPDHVRSRTHSELLRRLVKRETLTLAELRKRPEVSASAHWQIVGTVEQAADEIIEWFEEGAIDGFIALPGGSEECLKLVCEKLLPLLAERGYFRRQYSHTTLRGHLSE
ncbi:MULTISPECIES: NtaA/DmoA family FMN-dependent monooxygenase [unclassified Pseudoalteromonas]|uniref:NtaA/DmoA family FMN-dependent monooxygenase n=1 Tax=unclassified Pseudoalteromonas TaxID=194690 RepID=UPI0019807844